jgi:hypothetical protein
MLITLVAGGCVCVPSESDLLDNLPMAAAHLRANFKLLWSGRVFLLRDCV